MEDFLDDFFGGTSGRSGSNVARSFSSSGGRRNSDVRACAAPLNAAGPGSDGSGSGYGGSKSNDANGNFPVAAGCGSARFGEARVRAEAGAEEGGTGEILLSALLPPALRGVLPYERLNRMQSKCFDALWHGEGSVAVAAPTGSGKTALLELAIARLLMSSRDAAPPTHSPPGKVLYLAPMRSLCMERAADWRRKLPLLSVQVIIGGDEASAPLRAAVETADVLITTPEKWDSMTRRWRDHRELIGQVALLCVDEVHLLGESGRGAVLEAVVTRMRTVASSAEVRARGWPAARLRVVALSAALPNVGDIGRWVGAGTGATFAFDESYRPVKLAVTVFGCESRRSPFLFERSLDARVLDIVRSHSRGRPTLVFCASRSGTRATAEQLVRDAAARPPSPFVSSPAHAAALAAAAAGAGDERLAAALRAGVGWHNAGESAAHRALVERLFLDGLLPVLCTTSTLSVGVNLPAYLVVVKSTQMYAGGGQYTEYPASSVLQMIGRAGRPQFETEGAAVILTQAETRHLYTDLAAGLEPVESVLHTSLVEHLASEVCLRTLPDAAAALAWLRSSFLYIRMCAAPAKYGLPLGAPAADVDAHLARLVNTQLFALYRAGCLALNAAPEDDGSALQPTSPSELLAAGPRVTLSALGPCFVLSQCYLRFATLALFPRLPRGAGVAGLLESLCGATEVAGGMIVRRDERKALREIKERLGRVRAKRGAGAITSVADKAFQLVQVLLGRLKLSAATAVAAASNRLGADVGSSSGVGSSGAASLGALSFSLRMEVRETSEAVARVLKGFNAYCLCAEVRSALATVGHVAARAVARALWHDDTGARLLLQADGLAEAHLPALHALGIQSLAGLARSSVSPAQLAAALKKPLAAGVALRAAVDDLGPHLMLTASQTGVRAATDGAPAAALIRVVIAEMPAPPEVPHTQVGGEEVARANMGSGAGAGDAADHGADIDDDDGFHRKRGRSTAKKVRSKANSGTQQAITSYLVPMSRQSRRGTRERVNVGASEVEDYETPQAQPPATRRTSVRRAAMTYVLCATTADLMHGLVHWQPGVSGAGTVDIVVPRPIAGPRVTVQLLHQTFHGFDAAIVIHPLYSADQDAAAAVEVGESAKSSDSAKDGDAAESAAAEPTTPATELASATDADDTTVKDSDFTDAALLAALDEEPPAAPAAMAEEAQSDTLKAMSDVEAPNVSQISRGSASRTLDDPLAADASSNGNKRSKKARLKLAEVERDCDTARRTEDAPSTSTDSAVAAQNGASPNVEVIDLAGSAEGLPTPTQTSRLPLPPSLQQPPLPPPLLSVESTEAAAAAAVELAKMSEFFAEAPPAAAEEEEDDDNEGEAAAAVAVAATAFVDSASGAAPTTSPSLAALERAIIQAHAPSQSLSVAQQACAELTPPETTQQHWPRGSSLGPAPKRHPVLHQPMPRQQPLRQPAQRQLVRQKAPRTSVCGVEKLLEDGATLAALNDVALAGWTAAQGVHAPSATTQPPPPASLVLCSASSGVFMASADADIKAPDTMGAAAASNASNHTVTASVTQVTAHRPSPAPSHGPTPASRNALTTEADSAAPALRQPLQTQKSSVEACNLRDADALVPDNFARLREAREAKKPLHLSASTHARSETAALASEAAQPAVSTRLHRSVVSAWARSRISAQHTSRAISRELDSECEQASPKIPPPPPQSPLLIVIPSATTTPARPGGSATSMLASSQCTSASHRSVDLSFLVDEDAEVAENVIVPEGTAAPALERFKAPIQPKTSTMFALPTPPLTPMRLFPDAPRSVTQTLAVPAQASTVLSPDLSAAQCLQQYRRLPTPATPGAGAHGTSGQHPMLSVGALQRMRSAAAGGGAAALSALIRRRGTPPASATPMRLGAVAGGRLDMPARVDAAHDTACAAPVSRALRFLSSGAEGGAVLAPAVPTAPTHANVAATSGTPTQSSSFGARSGQWSHEQALAAYEGMLQHWLQNQQSQQQVGPPPPPPPPPPQPNQPLVSAMTWQPGSGGNVYSHAGGSSGPSQLPPYALMEPTGSFIAPMPAASAPGRGGFMTVPMLTPSVAWPQTDDFNSSANTTAAVLASGAPQTHPSSTVPGITPPRSHC